MRRNVTRLGQCAIALATAGLAAWTAAPAFAGTVTAKSTPAPSGKVTIEVKAINGSGCPQGTAVVTPNRDNTGFSVEYHQFNAQTGAGTSPTEARRNCQLGVLITVPSGFTYAVARATYNGYAYLQDGATASEKANYYFQGQSASVASTHTFSGPMNDRWSVTDVAAEADIVYAPCGEQRILNINTDLRVRPSAANPKAPNFIVMDTSKGSVRTLYHFQWKQC
jgi:hypothetical protein